MPYPLARLVTLRRQCLDFSHWFSGAFSIRFNLVFPFLKQVRGS